MSFNQNEAISTLNGKSLKLEDLFIYLGNNIPSSKSDIKICTGKALTAIDRILIIWKSDLSDEIK